MNYRITEDKELGTFTPEYEKDDDWVPFPNSDTSHDGAVAMINSHFQHVPDTDLTIDGVDPNAEDAGENEDVESAEETK